MQAYQQLQQYLPFTVLKQASHSVQVKTNPQKLQQYLPFTVLKLPEAMFCSRILKIVATVLTVYGIET